MNTTTARMTRYGSRAPAHHSTRFSDILAGLAFAAAIAFAAAMVFGLVG